MFNLQVIAATAFVKSDIYQLNLQTCEHVNFPTYQP